MVTVVTCVEDHELAELSTYWLKINSTPDLNTVILLDNGSQPPLHQYHADVLVRNEENTGANDMIHSLLPDFKELVGYEPDVVAYLHCDTIIRESEWDRRVIEEFEADDKLAMAGFLGSAGCDINGMYMAPIVRNFRGSGYTKWNGDWFDAGFQVGTIHRGSKPAAFLDHCAMVFRIKHLKKLVPQAGNYAPHHYYDKILCLQVLERGLHVRYIGVLMDHFCVGTGKGIENSRDAYTTWLKEQGLYDDRTTIDMNVYGEAERLFMKEFRDEKKILPCHVNEDYTVVFTKEQDPNAIYMTTTADSVVIDPITEKRITSGVSNDTTI